MCDGHTLNIEDVMASIIRFEDLDAWKEGRKLINMVYRITKNDEFSKDFALTKQIRRAVLSVNANIAEGFERNANAEFSYFLSVAKGSSGEVRNFLYVALDQQYVNKEEFAEVYEQSEIVSRLIAGLMRYLKKSKMKGSRRKPT